MSEPKPPPSPRPEHHAVPPSLDDVIDHYRRGVTAWHDAQARFAAGERDGHEQQSAAAFRELGRACEGAMVHAVARVTHDSESARLNMADQIKRLRRKRRGSYGDDLLDRLGDHRKRRNQVEHGGLLPTAAAVEAVLADTRKFLVDELSIPVERLAVIESAADPATLPDDSSSCVDLILGAQPDVFIQRAIERGLAKLASRQPDPVGLLHRALRHDGRPLLARAARSLRQAGRSPGDPLPDDTLVTDLLRDETHIRAELLGSPDGGDPRLDHRLALLLRRTALCVQAEWFAAIPDHDSLTFHDPILAQVLVGQTLPNYAPDLSNQRRAIARDLAWAMTAWADVRAHATAPAWVEAILADFDPANSRDQIATLCLVLGALQPDQVAQIDLPRALSLALHGLVAFEPRSPHAAPGWVLPMDLWCACALSLATASRDLGDEFSVDLPALVPCPAPLEPLFAALAITPSGPRLAALTTMCLLHQTVRAGTLTTGHIAEFGRVDPWITAWVRYHFIPVALASGDSTYLDLLARIAPDHPANLLPQDATLHNQWFLAWTRLVRPGVAAMIDAWLSAVLWQLHAPSTAERIDLFLGRCPDRLRESGLWPAAQERLRAQLATWSLPDAATSFVRALFDLAELTVDTWADHLALRTQQPELAWRCLLDCGAPQADIARWCLQVLADKASTPEGQRDGPIGVITLSPGLRVLSSAGWRLAFDQAPECLVWLIDHGDSSALAIIAESCLAPFDDGAVFDPIIGKGPANLFVPLSHELWPRILSRSAGRLVLYARIENDRCTGSWFAWDPVLQALASDPLLADEIPRMFACFARWLDTVWIVATNAHLYDDYFKRHGIPPPTAFPFALHLREDPWCRNEWPLHQCFALCLAAQHGIDVARPWRVLATRLAAEVARFPTPIRQQLSEILAYALMHLAHAHPDSARSVTTRDGLRVYAGIVCTDNAQNFWSTFVGLYGVDELLAALDDSSAPDHGCAAVELLAELAPVELERRWDLPAYLNPALRAAARGSLPGMKRLWLRLWAHPRELAVVQPYLDEVPGQRLDAIFEALVGWPPTDRAPILQFMARNSPHRSVRARAIALLLPARTDL